MDTRIPYRGTRLFKASPKAGNTNVYSLKRNHNEMIDDFKVTVRAVSPTEIRVTVMGVDGRTVLTTDFVNSNSEGKLTAQIDDFSRRRTVTDSDCER